MLLITLAAALLLVGACNDDDECTTCPPPQGGPMPTMANIWPHEDGTAWTYDIEYRENIPYPEPTGKAGEIPTMEELHDALQEPLPGASVTDEDGIYRIAFDGMRETESGATGQKGIYTFFTELYGEVTNAGGKGNDPLLATIARARPDLREALVRSHGLEEKSLDEVSAPLFLSPYAFSAEEDGLYDYGDGDLNHAWVYLEGDLSVGSEFSLQLIPYIKDDIWLYGRVWSVRDREIGGRMVENVLECMYVLDMGEAQLTDENGNVIGTVYPYSYGVTMFAPEAGPVAAVQRDMLAPDSILQDGAPTMIEYVMDGVGVTFPE
jgi:hypothetical protein